MSCWHKSPKLDKIRTTPRGRKEGRSNGTDGKAQTSSATSNPAANPDQTENKFFKCATTKAATRQFRCDTKTPDTTSTLIFLVVCGQSQPSTHPATGSNDAFRGATAAVHTHEPSFIAPELQMNATSDFHVGLAEPAAMLTTFTSKSINLNSDHTDKNCEHKHTTRHSLCLPLVRNVEHIAADVYAKPDVSGLFQRFAAQATPTPDVENEARFSWLRPMMFPRIRCKGE